MAVKGSVAKEAIIKKIAAALGENWIGLVDKNYYCWSEEAGERVQIKISLTIPKEPVDMGEAKPASSNGWDWFEPAKAVAPNNPAPAEITEEEINNLQTMLEKLGL